MPRARFPAGARAVGRGGLWLGRPQMAERCAANAPERVQAVGVVPDWRGGGRNAPVRLRGAHLPARHARAVRQPEWGRPGRQMGAGGRRWYATREIRVCSVEEQEVITAPSATPARKSAQRGMRAYLTARLAMAFPRDWKAWRADPTVQIRLPAGGRP